MSPSKIIGKCTQLAGFLYGRSHGTPLTEASTLQLGSRRYSRPAAGPAAVRLECRRQLIWFTQRGGQNA